MFRRCFFIFIWGIDYLNGVLIREISLSSYMTKQEDSFMTTKREATNPSTSQPINEKAIIRNLSLVSVIGNHSFRIQDVCRYCGQFRCDDF